MTRPTSGRRKLSFWMMVVGTIIAWLTMIAPATAMVSWLRGTSTGVWLLVSLLLAPPAFAGLWWAIRRAQPKPRWLIMQYFGWSAVLLPITVVGMIASIWLQPQTVAVAVFVAWLVLGVLGVAAATRIAERSLIFAHDLLDRPYRLVQLSDVHVGSRSAGFLRRAIKQALSHRPDALLLTGDLIDLSTVKADDMSPLGEVPCPVYFAIGNHERYIDLNAVIEMVEDLGIDLLRNRSVTHGRLQIVGIDDADDPDQVGDNLPGIALSDDHYRILLYHKPDGWHAARQAGIDLMLAGHTHGGQIWPFNHLVKRRFEHLIGLFSQDDQHLYVSPGTGSWGPVMRLGTRSEMTVIDLVPAEGAR
ncbi:MAG: metallophosphoesterase [Geminicoccaceae bacterium]